MPEYRNIKGFPGYRVGDDGSVWSSRVTGSARGRRGEWKRAALHRRPYGSRYVMVCMRADPGGAVSCHYVHRLILEAFVGKCPDGMQCRHFPDPDTSNNRLENLSWGTAAANAADRRIHGTQLEGARNPGATHTEDDILTIFRLRERGKTQSEIGAAIRMSQPGVSAVLRGKSWASTTRALAAVGLLRGGS